MTRLTSDRPTLVEIDAWIDTLDRAEPAQAGWRAAFDRLKDSLTRARRVRRMIRTPGWALIFILLAALFVLRLQDPGGDLQQWVRGVATALAALLLIWEFALRRAFPVLEREGRVASLLRYYGAKDVPDEQEVY